MTTGFDSAKAALTKFAAHHELALSAIETIGKLAKEALVKPGSNAAAVLQVIERVIDTLTAGFDGKVTVAEVDRQLRALVDGIAKNDAAIDAGLAARSGGAHE